MKLTNEGLKQAAEWKKADVALPGYDREKMLRAT